MTLIFRNNNLSQGTMCYAIAISIKAMVSLISLSPTMFPAPHALLEQRTHPIGPTRYPAEDWHRAHQLLRIAFCQQSDAEAKANSSLPISLMRAMPKGSPLPSPNSRAPAALRAGLTSRKGTTKIALSEH